MLRHPSLPAVLALAATVCGIFFTGDATGLALFGCILLSSGALYALALQPKPESGPGLRMVLAYGAIMAAAIIAGMLPSEYPYLSLVVGSVYGALAVGCAIGFFMGSSAPVFFRWLCLPAGLWVVVAALSYYLADGPKSSFLSDSNSYATALNLTFLLMLGLLAGNSRSTLLKAAAGIGLVFCLVGMFYVQSKGAWIALLITLALLGVVARGSLGVTRRHWVMLALLAVLAALSVSSRIQVEKAESRDGRSTSSRKAMLVSTLEIIKAHPLGVGTGQWFRAYSKVRVSDDVESAGLHAHNDYLEAVAESSVFGLAALAAPGLFALWMAVRLRRESDRLRARRQAILIALVAVCALQAAVNFTFQQVAFNFIVGMACGTLLQSWGLRARLPLPRSSRQAMTSSFVAFSAAVVVSALSYTTLHTQTLPEPLDSKALPFLKDERTLVLLSKLNPFDVRPRVTYAAMHHRIAANAALPFDLRKQSYFKGMNMYLDLNRTTRDDFQLLATAGGMAKSVGQEFDPSARALAEALLRRAYQLAPAQVAVALPYAEVLFSLGRFDLADTVLRETADKVAENDRIMLQAALADLRKNRPAAK